MARTLGKKAIGVYVINASEYSSLHHSTIKESARSGLKDKGEVALSKLKEMAEEKSVELETEIEEGKPYKEIVKIAGANDVIYISSHGLSGFSQLFLGSTTQRVLKHANCTVSVVSGGYTELPED